LRKTKFILIKNSAFSILRVVLPFAFIGFGAFGIFSAYVSALFVGFGIVFLILMYKFDYKPKLVFYDNIIKKIGKYSLGNYVAGFIGGLSLLVLPLMITNVISPTTTAYYFMAMQIANLLFVIPTATTNSLFAEGSYNENNLNKQVKKSIKIIAILLIPTIILIIFFGQYILLAFGREYSDAGINFLRIMALSGIFVAGNKIFEGVAKVNKRITKIAIVNLIGVVIIIGGSLLFIKNGYGLLGVGYAYILGQFAMMIFYGGMKVFEKGKKN
jgi:O-antigen/teichoic acid export membrane protein